jgi:hypothetical protein
VAEGRRSRGWGQWWWNFNDPGYERWKRERDGVRPYLEGRAGGGEAAPWCRRRMRQQSVARWPLRPKVASGSCWLKIIKGNWVGGSNAWLVRSADWVGEKNMAKSMR